MIVGTAGHVDHGKTALVQALTGIDTDRLKEEKARGITIDLGFAYMPGPDGQTIGFVDVPGHERFVRTMVAGAAGIDFALMVVAGDDGIMPQTREHLDILGLLGLRRGLFVVSKADKIDAARRKAVAKEISAAAAGSTLAGADMLFVSALTGDGLAALRARLEAEARRTTARDDAAAFRLSVDRSFSLVGVGTVAAGLVLDGAVGVGDAITILPHGRSARIRSLHAQNRTATRGRAGERCALALSGIAKEDVPRGAWLCGGDAGQLTQRCDADVRLLASAGKPLGEWTPVHFHCGASDVVAHVTALSDTKLPAGSQGFVQIALDHALPLRHGDLFVLRDQNARRTIGGGRILDPRAMQRHRRSPERLSRLDALRHETPDAAMTALLSIGSHVEDATAFAQDRGLKRAALDALCTRLGLRILLSEDRTFVCHDTVWHELRAKILAGIGAFHEDHPELPGVAEERLRAQLFTNIARRPFHAICGQLLGEGAIVAFGHVLRLPGHVARMRAEDLQLVTRMVPLVAQDRFRPPRVRDIAATLDVPEANVRRACKSAARIGRLIEIGQDRFFLRETVLEMAGIAQGLTPRDTHELFTAAAFRDRLDNGRKVAIEILEFFDRSGLTHRQDDLRRVVKDAAAVFGTMDVGDTG